MNRHELYKLVDQQVARSVASTINRHVEVWADQIISDMLREPGIREQLQALLLAALTKALADLQREVEEL